MLRFVHGAFPRDKGALIPPAFGGKLELPRKSFIREDQEMDMPMERQGKKGIKVKDLAHDLGLTSRELIDRCRAEGLFVQNSITRLNRTAEARVRGWFTRGASDGKPAT